MPNTSNISYHFKGFCKEQITEPLPVVCQDLFGQNKAAELILLKQNAFVQDSCTARALGNKTSALLGSYHVSSLPDIVDNIY